MQTKWSAAIAIILTIPIVKPSIARAQSWVVHRPGPMLLDRRANTTPPALEFDSAGKLLAS